MGGGEVKRRQDIREKRWIHVRFYIPQAKMTSVIPRRTRCARCCNIWNRLRAKLYGARLTPLTASL